MDLQSRNYKVYSIEKEFCDTLDILTDFTKPKCIVAFSGGVDSLALLALCIKAFGTEKIVPVYVNHNIRSNYELDKEIELNKFNCKNLGVDLVIREIDKGLISKLSKGLGTEAAARGLRYRILEEERVLENCSFILTAHHRNDQIETVLMKIIGNAPITGLRGISYKWNNTLRPLLEFDKKQLEEYVSVLGLEYSTDSTNCDNSIKRNEVRNLILPQLKKLMPDCENRILRLRNYAVSQCKNIEQVYDHVDVLKFNSYNEAQKIMVLYEMWDNVVGTSLPQTLLNRVLKGQIKASANGGTFYTYNGILYLVNDKNIQINRSFSKEFDFNCERTELPYNLFIVKKSTGKSTDLSLNPELFKGKVYLRFPVNGEKIVLKDGSKTVNKLLQDMKVPDVFRPMVPVLADEDGLCVVFGSVFGGKDRICDKLRSSLALSNYYKYICYKGI